jgi:membrane-bound metal-dependent hydrolase YbcI (DUF457 family)
MDPVTHAIAARMAASIARSPLPRAAAVLSVAAGLAPDLDAIFMPAGWDVYLRVHEVGTHSAVGGVLLAAAMAAAWRPFTALAFRPLFVTAVIAVSTHILLDVISGATIRVGWPVLGGRTAIGLVAMADPWLAVPVVVALLIALVSKWRVDRVAPVTFMLLAAILGTKWISRQMALAEYQTVADRAAVSRDVHAQWSSLTRWWVYEQTSDRLRLWDIDSWRPATTRVLDRERAHPGQMIEGEAELWSVHNFLLAHHLPIRVSSRTDASTTVFWSDLRFCFAPDPRSGPRPGSRLRPTEDAIACGVWFGGELDPSGRIVGQFVTIGDFVQKK